MNRIGSFFQASNIGSVQRQRRLSALVALAALPLMFAVSCSGKVDATIRDDETARIGLRLNVPDLLAARIRQFTNIPANGSLFDPGAVRKQFSGRDTMFLVDASSSEANSMTAVLWIPNLKKFAEDKSLVPAGMLEYRKIPAAGSAPAMRELGVTLSRENASAMFGLFPGVDRRIIDSLSPPAFEKDPVSSADYRMNLETVIIGKKAMPAFDLCAVEIVLSAPKTILESSGGTASGQVFKAKLPLFDLLTLEKPIHFSVRWAD